MNKPSPTLSERLAVVEYRIGSIDQKLDKISESIDPITYSLKIRLEKERKNKFFWKATGIIFSAVLTGVGVVYKLLN